MTITFEQLIAERTNTLLQRIEAIVALFATKPACHVTGEVTCAHGFITCHMKTKKDAEVLQQFVLHFVHPLCQVNVQNRTQVVIVIDEETV